jgi:hypothetical protein
LKRKISLNIVVINSYVPLLEHSWIYNYLCNQCLSPLRVSDTFCKTLFRKIYYIIKSLNKIERLKYCLQRKLTCKKFTDVNISRSDGESLNVISEDGDKTKRKKQKQKRSSRAGNIIIITAVN